MNEIKIPIEIMLNEDSSKIEFFETEEDSKINLGKGIMVFDESENQNKIQLKIIIIKDNDSYNPNITPTILGNIISSWFVYKLTGKKCRLKINEKEISVRKNLITKIVEKHIEKTF